MSINLFILIFAEGPLTLKYNLKYLLVSGNDIPFKFKTNVPAALSTESYSGIGSN